MLGVDYDPTSAVPAAVRDTILRPMDPAVDDYDADVFAEAVSAEAWTAKYAYYRRGGVDD